MKLMPPNEAFEQWSKTPLLHMLDKSLPAVGPSIEEALRQQGAFEAARMAFHEGYLQAIHNLKQAIEEEAKAKGQTMPVVLGDDMVPTTPQ